MVPNKRFMHYNFEELTSLRVHNKYPGGIEAFFDQLVSNVGYNWADPSITQPIPPYRRVLGFCYAHLERQEFVGLEGIDDSMYLFFPSLGGVIADYTLADGVSEIGKDPLVVSRAGNQVIVPAKFKSSGIRNIETSLAVLFPEKPLSLREPD